MVTKRFAQYLFVEKDDMTKEKALDNRLKLMRKIAKVKYELTHIRDFEFGGATPNITISMSEELLCYFNIDRSYMYIDNHTVIIDEHACNRVTVDGMITGEEKSYIDERKHMVGYLERTVKETNKYTHSPVYIEITDGCGDRAIIVKVTLLDFGNPTPYIESRTFDISTTLSRHILKWIDEAWLRAMCTFGITRYGNFKYENGSVTIETDTHVKSYGWKYVSEPKEITFHTTEVGKPNMTKAVLNSYYGMAAAYERQVLGRWCADAKGDPRISTNADSKLIKYPGIKEVIYNKPATIILWLDGTKTVVKCKEDEAYDKEKGFVMAVLKRLFGNDGKYYEMVKRHVPFEKEAEEVQNDIIEHLSKLGTEHAKLELEKMLDRIQKKMPDMPKPIECNCNTSDIKELSVKEYASLIGRSESTVLRMIKKGDIQGYKKKGGIWAIPMVALK